MSDKVLPLRNVTAYRIGKGSGGLMEPAEMLVASKYRRELQSLMAMTSDHVRDEIGQLALCLDEERLYHEWSTPIKQAMMSMPFSASCASDGSVRLLYMSLDRETEILATTNYYSAFFSALKTPSLRLRLTLYRIQLDGDFADSTGHSQEVVYLRNQARIADSMKWSGIVFDGPDGSPAKCLALLRMSAIRYCEAESSVEMSWDGDRLVVNAESGLEH